MKTLHVSASQSYDILIGQDLLKDAGSHLAAFDKVKKIVLVSDDNVYPLYGEKVKTSLEAAGLQVFSFVFPHGEQSKCLQVYGQLLEFMDSCRLNRSDMAAALGGGVTGDLTGFAAATFLRGIRYVQLPTSLLAMVDSSVGGKTAIDLPAGKNHVGSFWQPSLVLCDTDTLKTLPPEQYRCGCAEIIKTGVLGSRAIFDMVMERPVIEQPEEVVAACVDLKRQVVEADEFDRGERMKLNLGHTLGHAVEALSSFEILHGQAVAIGMACVMRIARAKGMVTEEEQKLLMEALEKYGLPTEAPYTAEQMADLMLTDKKVLAGTLKAIMPTAIGSCVIEDVPAPSIKSWMALGGIR